MHETNFVIIEIPYFRVGSKTASYPKHRRKLLLTRAALEVDHKLESQRRTISENCKLCNKNFTGEGYLIIFPRASEFLAHKKTGSPLYFFEVKWLPV
ncbi:MAG TPA: hypothetical protein DCY03_03200 [Planctomycetaceae bacterium]|nr:hypothetical protein [Planctomycetaceae bacterium]